MLDDEGGLLHGGPYCCGHMGEEGRGERRRGEIGRGEGEGRGGEEKGRGGEEGGQQITYRSSNSTHKYSYTITHGLKLA